MKPPRARPRSVSHLPKAPASQPRVAKSANPGKPTFKRRTSTKSSPNTSKSGASVTKLRSVNFRIRRTIAGLSVLAVLVISAVMITVNFSSVLAIEQIKVVGTDRLSSKSIQNALQAQVGVSLAQVDPAQVADQLKSFSLIESVDVVASPPHTLLIRITERAPIAIVVLAGSAVLVDPAGIQIGPATANDDYPVVDVTTNPRGNANFRAAVDVLLALPSELYPQVAGISARSKDDVTLQLRSVANQQIVWGDGSQSALKSKVLAALFKNTKRNVPLTIDVSAPDAPVVRY